MAFERDQSYVKRMKYSNYYDKRYNNYNYNNYNYSGICRNCKRKDHMTKYCPYLKCYWCHEMGHLVKNCSQGPAKNCVKCRKVAFIRCFKQGKFYCDVCYDEEVAKSRNIKEFNEETKFKKKESKANEVFNSQY